MEDRQGLVYRAVTQVTSSHAQESLPAEGASSKILVICRSNYVTNLVYGILVVREKEGVCYIQKLPELADSSKEGGPDPVKL